MNTSTINVTNRVNGSLILYFFNTYLALLAANMFLYGLVIFTTQLTGATGFTGLVFLATFLLPLLFSIWAGVLIDRYSRKTILICSQFIFVTSALILYSLISTGSLINGTRWLLLMNALINGAGYTLMIPARLAIIGDLTPQDNIAKSTIIMNVLVILGFSSAPIIAGQIREHLGFGNLFLAIGLIFAVAISLLLLIRPKYVSQQKRTSTNIALRESFAYIFQNRLVAQLLLFTAIALFMLGPIQVIFPRFAQITLHMGEGARGMFLSFLGAGLFAGSILAGFLNRLRYRGWLIITTALTAGAVTIFFAQATDTSLAMALLATIGLCGGVANTLVPAALQDLVPGQMRGRIMSVYSLIFQITPAVTGAISGLLADKIGLSNGIALAGITVFGLVLVASVFMPAIRNYK
jgi:MFS family permease